MTVYVESLTFRLITLDFVVNLTVCSAKHCYSIDGSLYGLIRADHLAACVYVCLTR